MICPVSDGRILFGKSKDDDAIKLSKPEYIYKKKEAKIGNSRMNDIGTGIQSESMNRDERNRRIFFWYVEKTTANWLKHRLTKGPSVGWERFSRWCVGVTHDQDVG